MRIFLLVFVVIHGLIHLTGFVKGFHLAEMKQLTRPISILAGTFWLVAAVFFLVSGGLFVISNPSWWILGAIAIVVSQVLIILSWTDAKFGTLGNVIVLIPIVFTFVNTLPSSFSKMYEAKVQEGLARPFDESFLREEDLKNLPQPVQRYLRYVGVVGRAKVQNFRAVFDGDIKRNEESDWIRFRSRQYNFFDKPSRLFYIQSSMFGIPFDGLHAYTGNSATMQIRIASLFQIVDAKGEKMTQGETVTLFNDMCVMAPATLIDPAIQWESIDSLEVRAKFTNAGDTISAVLSFNERGELTDFISGDRFLSADGKTYERYPWSTPVKNYREFSGRMIPIYVEAIWRLPKRDYTYGKFTLREIEYNCRVFR